MPKKHVCDDTIWTPSDENRVNKMEKHISKVDANPNRVHGKLNNEELKNKQPLRWARIQKLHWKLFTFVSITLTYKNKSKRNIFCIKKVSEFFTKIKNFNKSSKSNVFTQNLIEKRCASSEWLPKLPTIEFVVPRSRVENLKLNVSGFLWKQLFKRCAKFMALYYLKLLSLTSHQF